MWLNSSDAHVNGIHLENAGPVWASICANLPDVASSSLSSCEGWAPPSLLPRREEPFPSAPSLLLKHTVLPSLIHNQTVFCLWKYCHIFNIHLKETSCGAIWRGPRG